MDTLCPGKAPQRVAAVSGRAPEIVKASDPVQGDAAGGGVGGGETKGNDEPVSKSRGKQQKREEKGIGDDVNF